MNPEIRRIGYWLYRGFWTSVDWVYPPDCGGCNQPGARWCPACQEQVKRISGPICSVCGDSILEGEMCSDCLKEPPSFTKLRSWALFIGPLRNAIHRLKYRNDLGLGEWFSRYLTDYFQQMGWPVELIVPVPLSQKRLQERGYNQSSLLARPIALAAKIPFRTNSLLRARETASQVKLSAVERLENVRDAFIAKPEHVCGKIVMVVDDVTTTGSTMQACSKALLDAGAIQVFGLTLARSAFGMDDFQANCEANDLSIVA